MYRIGLTSYRCGLLKDFFFDLYDLNQVPRLSVAVANRRLSEKTTKE